MSNVPESLRIRLLEEELKKKVKDMQDMNINVSKEVRNFLYSFPLEKTSAA